MLKALSLTPQESANVIDNSLKKEIIKALAALLKSFPKKLGKDINEILAQVWSCLVQSSHIYVNKIVNSNSYVENVTVSNSANDSCDFEGEY